VTLSTRTRAVPVAAEPVALVAVLPSSVAWKRSVFASAAPANIVVAAASASSLAVMCIPVPLFVSL